MTAVETTDAQVVEGTVVEEHGTAMVPTSVLAVAPTVPAAELVARLDSIREAAEKAMQEGVDYGKVPGTDKPTLFKPGAEKLSVLFQLDVQLANEKVWGPGDHLTVISRATVFHAPSGARLGYGEGICTTREKKYAYRNAERACPQCGKANIRKSKKPGEGFYCWVKTEGCGATFPEDDGRILEQQVGQVENPELPDLWNTVVKMAEKRARVDAVLAVTGASAIFTQDVEDLQSNGDAPRADQTVHAAAPEPPAVAFVTKEDIVALQQAAEGLTGQQIKLAMGACGVPIPDPFMWNRVPQDKAAALARKLAETERAS